MTNHKQTTEKPASEQAVLEALASNPDATVADVAAAAKVGRSTAGKVLTRLTSSGEIRRTEGGRDGARRLPDRFALASAETAAADGEPKAAEDATPKAAADAKPNAPGKHLKPGQLDGLVLAYLLCRRRHNKYYPDFRIMRMCGQNAASLVGLATCWSA
jgi:hypothetical protein